MIRNKLGACVGEARVAFGVLRVNWVHTWVRESRGTPLPVPVRPCTPRKERWAAHSLPVSNTIKHKRFVMRTTAEAVIRKACNRKR